MENCDKCGKPAIINIGYLGKSYCKDCFLEFFEKKVLATLRGNLPSHGRVGFDTSTLGGKVVEHIVKPFALKARNECVKLGKVKNAGNLDLVLTGETLDDLNADTLAYLLGANKKLEKANSIMPLMKCTDEELHVYAKIKGIKAKDKAPDDFIKLLKNELDALENKHPGTKKALLKTREYLLPLTNKA